MVLLRELAGACRRLLERLVILVAADYNPDGNDALGPQSVNRSEQNGPELVGQRADGMNLDLNRDYLKAEAPETRASLARVYDTWDPAIMVDLHTTDGTLHGYLLTYAPPLDPSGPSGPSQDARDQMLPAIRKTLQERYHEPIFDYGNVDDPLAPKDDIRRVERAADRLTVLEGMGAAPRPTLAVAYRLAGRGAEAVLLQVAPRRGGVAADGGLDRHRRDSRSHPAHLEPARVSGAPSPPSERSIRERRPNPPNRELLVGTAQPLGRLVFALLEPTGYGFARRGMLDRWLGAEFGAYSGLVYGSAGVSEFPVWRAARVPGAALRIVP